MSKHTITLGQLNAPLLGVTIMFGDGIAGELLRIEHGIGPLDESLVGTTTKISLGPTDHPPYCSVTFMYPSTTPVTVLVARDDEDPRTVSVRREDLDESPPDVEGLILSTRNEDPSGD